MKRVRIGCGTAFLIMTIAIIVLVAIEWHKVGCTVWALVAQSIMYSVCSFGIWWTIDEFLAEWQERYEDDIHYGPQEEK